MLSNAMKWEIWFNPFPWNWTLDDPMTIETISEIVSPSATLTELLKCTLALHLTISPLSHPQINITRLSSSLSPFALFFSSYLPTHIFLIDLSAQFKTRSKGLTNGIHLYRSSPSKTSQRCVHHGLPSHIRCEIGERLDSAPLAWQRSEPCRSLSGDHYCVFLQAVE
jgi:hypothetical protein